jgi:hypothetical protein
LLDKAASATEIEEKLRHCRPTDVVIRGIPVL